MKKIIIIATFFAGFIQSAYGMNVKVIDYGADIPQNQKEMATWYEDNEIKIKNDLKISSTVSVYLPYADIKNKRYVSILTPGQVSALDFKGIVSLGRNVYTIDMNPLVEVLSSSASLAGINALQFAMKTVLALHSKEKSDQSKAIDLITPSSDENRKEIIDALRPRLKHVDQQEKILEEIEKKPIKTSSSLESTSPHPLRPTASFVIGGAILLGLAYILVTYGKIYAKGIQLIS